MERPPLERVWMASGARGQNPPGQGRTGDPGLEPAPWVQGKPGEAPPAQRPRRRGPAGRGAPGPEGAPRRPRRRPTRETMARVAVAIPWIVFAIAIVALGGIPFAVAMIGISVVGLAELYRMTRRFHPLAPVALAAAAALVIDVLVATFLTDTAAYAGGRLFGRHPLAPKLSPNKTVEGLAFGFVGGTAGFWFAGLYQDWLPGLDALIMGMCIAIVAPMGDLFESMIKRDLNIKDTGNVFGPHGGMLDRVDALMFTIVMGYYLSVAFLY